ncbi:hypothetical protein [Candidatus Ichthyocystis hellenicum]|uniref:hypothetical protein n=1 Tax=Candidatus Ichthyocystis hellenicum TaxID=1561003 RepID=UPI000B8A055A|nr:hypothetical protein [Candidatus Ichthyocystis hellenicum]
MHNVSFHGTECAQGDYDNSSVDLFVCNPDDFDRLPQGLCDWYECVSDFETISKVCDDSFLQEYAVSCGYKLTEDFLTITNKYKANFIDKVDSILIGLYDSFHGSKDLEDHDKNENLIYLMKQFCFSFSKCAYDLRFECVGVLRSDIVPAAIKIIFDTIVIDGDCERKMTYPEMERLFLHFINALEKLVIIKIMKYWQDFCLIKKKDISLISSVDYSNPFVCAYYFDNVNPPNIDCPAAFTHKFGEYISFIAVAKIESMMDNIIERCSDALKKVICYKCSYICNYSDNVYSDLKKLYDALCYNFNVLVEKEFNEKIENGKFNYNLSNFLGTLVIFSKYGYLETDRVSIVCSIIAYMKNLLVDRSIDNACVTVMGFYRSRVSPVKILSNGWKPRFDFRLHPEDNYRILSIRRKFSTRSKNVVRYTFCAMLNERHIFPDGTVVSLVDWDSISENLFPIAHEAVRCFVDNEHEELKNFLVNVRMFDDDNIFDGSSLGTRAATPEEIEKIFRLSVEYISNCNMKMFDKVWCSLISSSAKTTSVTEGVGGCSVLGGYKEDITSDMADVVKSFDGGDVHDTPSVQSELPFVTLMSVDWVKKRDKIFRVWGLNLHPADSSRISFIRRKFASEIRDYLIELFLGMVEKRASLSGDAKLFGSSWTFASGELYGIVTKSIDHINKRRHVELDRALSEARVVSYANESDSCIIRKITDYERGGLVIRCDRIVTKELKATVRSLWSHVVNASKSSTDVSYEENDGCTSGGIKEILRGGRFRRRNNADTSISTVVCVGDVPASDGGDAGSDLMSDIRCEDDVNFSYNIVRKRDKIISKWGLNLHPIDSKRINCIRRKFAIDVKNHLIELFSSMFKNGKVVLPSGLVLSDPSWPLVSSDLCRIATKSVDYITKRQHLELDRILSEARVNVYVDGSGAYTTSTRKVTDDEKKELMVRANKIVNNGLKVNIRLTWLSVLKDHSAGVSSENKIRSIYGHGREGKWGGVKLCYRDNSAILAARKKFFFGIREVVYNKFSSMLNGKHKFDDGTFIGAFAWFRVSEKLLPIAQDEVIPILEEERKELGKIVSVARVTDDSGVDRDLTNEERSAVLESVDNLVCVDKLSFLFKNIWNDVVASLSVNCVDVKGCAGSDSSVYIGERCASDGGDGVRGISICYEDDLEILKIKKRFTSEIRNCVRDKYIEIMRREADPVKGVPAWKDVSKKISPIIMREIDPIIERERIEIDDMLSRSRVDISSPDDCGKTRTTRELTYGERVSILGNIIGYVRRRASSNFCQLWNRFIRSPSMRFGDLREVDRLTLNNIKLEFVESLGSVVDDVVGLMSSDHDTPLHGLDSENILNVVSRRSSDLFEKRGFLSKVESVLSDSHVIDLFGNDRYITIKEKKNILKEFMDMVGADRDCFIRNRIFILDNAPASEVVILPVGQNLMSGDHSYSR